MLRSSAFALAAALASAAIAFSTPSLAQSQTIRIEPRPFYGATVTIEQGVRVWRGLPSTSHVIVNPTGAPVNLSIADVRETITSNNTWHGAPAGHAAAAPYAGNPTYYYGRPYGYGGWRALPGRRHGGHARGLTR